MKIEYIPGFLAFREEEAYKKIIQNFKDKNLDFYPQILFIDGNGLLHHNKVGMASHSVC